MDSALEFVQDLANTMEKEYRQTKRINPELKNQLIGKLLEFEGFENEIRKYKEDIGLFNDGKVCEEDGFASLNAAAGISAEAFFDNSWKLIAIIAVGAGIIVYGLKQGKDLEVDAWGFKFRLHGPKKGNPAPPTS